MKSIHILLSVFLLCCTISMHSQTMESEYLEKTKLEFDYFYSLQYFNSEYEYLHLTDSIEKNNFIAKKIIYDSQLIFDYIVDKIESDGFYSRKYSNSVFKNEANDVINTLFYYFVRAVYDGRFFSHLDITEDKRKLIIESIITRNDNNMIEPCEFNHLMYLLTKHDKYWEYLVNNDHVIRLTSSTSFVKAEPLVLCY